jgi:predicted cupin superfamily sugar epimerase
MSDADEIVKALALQPHPEGGWYRESFRDGASTAIYYLLKTGEVSRWHRVDKAEIWHWYAGAVLELSLSPDGKRLDRLRLGPDLAASQRPQAAVPPGTWQSARSLGAWTLLGCTVAPAFDFKGFELAPPGWEPGNPA